MRPYHLWSRMGGYSCLSLFNWYIVFSIVSFSRGQTYKNDKITRLESDQELGDFVVSDNHEMYVGGTNVIYHLDWNLKILESVRTGPEMDSARCHASGSCPLDVTKKLTNNVNKALVIDNENSQLIVCGSIRQGSCSKYQLHNISSQVEFLPEAVAANEAESSTFAFIGMLLHLLTQSIIQMYEISKIPPLILFSMGAA